MFIVDSQVHVWQVGTASDHHSNPRLPLPFATESLLALMNEVGVNRVILAPPSWDPGGDAYALAAAKARPDRFAVMGSAHFHNQAEGEEIMRGWMKQPGMLGMRFHFNSPDTVAELKSGQCDWIWAAAERENVPLMILAPGQMDEIAKIVERHPRLKVILDHLCIPRGFKDERAIAHFPELCKLARFPNLALKAGGLNGYSDKDVYPYKFIHEPLRQVIEAFGARRVHWATDLTRMRCPYRECITMFTEGMPWLSREDLEWIMGRAVCEWLAWKT